MYLPVLIYSIISIHAPAQGATDILQICLPKKGFQSTLPHRERQDNIIGVVVNQYFNPRSRTGSDQRMVGNLTITENFNPRSRTGSDPCRTCYGACVNISIHAPAQGATMPFLSVYVRVWMISIHAPAQGATVKRAVVPCDLAISIHAPAQGAT